METAKENCILHEEQQSYRLLIDNIQDYAIFMMDKSGVIISWNPGIRKLLGYEAEEILGRHFSILYPEDAIRENRCEFEIAQAGRESRFEDEGLRIRKNKTHFTAQVTINAIFNDQHEIHGYAKVIRDLTVYKRSELDLQNKNKELQRAYEDLRNAQYALQAMNSQLEINVKKRTKELMETNRSLMESNSMLKKINNDLDNFVYTASHDLKAPISNLEGLLEVLKEEMMPGQKGIVNVVELMDKSIQRFKNTIEDLTVISKVQKNIEEDIETINCAKLYEEVKDELRDKIVKANCEIYSDFSACDRIKFSRKNLRSIFYNLISNAIKYRCPKRNSIIHLQTKIKQDYITLEIEDNGLGIDLKQTDKVFGMFKRLHAHVEGSGLGLYIVKRIIENAGGKIELESQIGKGSLFRLFFRK
ncbi:MAG TPA: PAS domain-containing sensor histidine kinase [Cytophagaceae bacterium]|nr:PAS domain-containing sensor histidine kinase [Cytophagaceae bacterium]